MQRRTAGWLLVVAGLACMAAAWVVWAQESDRADKDERVALYLDEDADEADRAPSFAIGGVGSVVLLAGVVLIALSPQPTNSTNP